MGLTRSAVSSANGCVSCHVQWVDVTAADPGLLVHLKSVRNTVPVPKHWGQKRKYLQNKRGLEKLPFVLPGALAAPPAAAVAVGASL